ncbi:MAG: aminotransferase [Marinilabiliales bacterium]|nr:MAG: aminotransferase [Marinilabiliales bacterium]
MKIQPANRIGKVEEYYFSKKLAEVNMLKQQGKPIINLGIGSPDLPTHPDVIEELNRSSREKGSNYYQPYRGIPELREAFSAWYQDIYNVNLNPANEILPLIGSKEGIMHISMAFANPGDQVLIPNPGYPAYTSVSKLLNLNVQYYNLNEDNNWLPDISELEALAQDNCKIIWINYPHMPSGAKADTNSFRELIEFAQSRNILVVHDNPYSLILNNEPMSLLQGIISKSHVLELNSLSKSHNMAGWRIGMVAGSEENINHILKVKSNFDSGMFKPLQQAAAKALQLPHSWYNEINKLYSERRKLVWQIMDQMGCTYGKNTSGMFVWAKVPNNYKNGAELSDELLYEHSIFTAPGFIFGSNGNGYTRISLCADMHQLKEALKRVETIKELIK